MVLKVFVVELRDLIVVDTGLVSLGAGVVTEYYSYEN